VNRRTLLAQAAALGRPTAREPRPGGTDGNRAPAFRIENATADTAELWLYAEIGGWFGVWADEFVEELRQVTAPNITVRMSSGGGDVFDGIAIGNALAAHPARVTVQIDSLAASIASVIAVTAGDEVVMAANAQMMIHEASGGCFGGSQDFRAMADLLDKIGGIIAQCYADRAGGDVSQWADAMAQETWYTASEAVAAGLADRVLPAKAKAAPPDEDGGDMAAAAAAGGWKYHSRAQAPAPRIAAKAAPTPKDVFGGNVTASTANTITVTWNGPVPDTTALVAAIKGGITATAPDDEDPPAEAPPVEVSEDQEAIPLDPPTDTPDTGDSTTETPAVAVSQGVSDTLPTGPRADTVDHLAALRDQIQSDPLARLREAIQ
jgi:ATP-dependent protease ClpP protease subunit